MSKSNPILHLVPTIATFDVASEELRTTFAQECAANPAKAAGLFLQCLTSFAEEREANVVEKARSHALEVSAREWCLSVIDVGMQLGVDLTGAGAAALATRMRTKVQHIQAENAWLTKQLDEALAKIPA